ncbi:hypothetical protein GCM10018790_01650 [Kitasatospora xanthocidica]|uniref:DUF2637 domain-containing protein n=1 Tax=Kitasatospora xanthocidica TaxID=83382 RepID=UPI001992111C|nr:DUF2637 domain-containing protein [Kitasatospora xanthocidica]GHF27929.1 hypothetical protein GCM10018790_01650 [Kitasatospora xanthocidica]
MSQEQIRSAERALAVGTWTITLGAVLYSMLTVTPLMSRHTPDGWGWTAPILPLVVDAAVVIVVRMDSTLTRLGGDGGRWPVVLRWMTGLMTVLLNVGQSALDRDKVGVAVHAVAPLLLIVTAETSLAYRKAIAAALAAREARERDERAERERRAEARRRQDREDRMAEYDRADRAERERREHDERMTREQREHEERMAREERTERARREDAQREEHRLRADAERREHERREREASERERRERDREQNAEREIERLRQDLLSAPAVDERLPEDEARLKIQTCVVAGVPQRRAVELTGWSAGWVAARYQELRATERPALHAVPATTEETTAPRVEEQAS